ncbi:hypothetical protein RA11412_1625 [Rothia aeria]|uniref:Uncharacterized protein n=1 Tax=Rothia aeria TaxID=172042 RepID=A0A2Z5R0C7_9MICC|nr:hypothetical protein RA11412_1625 [Rothia aeria]
MQWWFFTLPAQTHPAPDIPQRLLPPYSAATGRKKQNKVRGYPTERQRNRAPSHS